MRILSLGQSSLGVLVSNVDRATATENLSMVCAVPLCVPVVPERAPAVVVLEVPQLPPPAAASLHALASSRCGPLYRLLAQPGRVGQP